MDVQMFTVGPLAENTFLVLGGESRQAVIVDPGDEAPRLLAGIREAGAELVAILLTHTHIDHVGAVAPLARETGAPVYCPASEAFVLADIASWTPLGFPAAEPYDADVMLEGGERLELAGLEIDVISTPGHSPGHLSYSIPAEQALFSGDVLFQQSVGRTDLPGGDAPTLMRSIAHLLDVLPDATQVHPGHMGLTTLGHERVQNPFLARFASR
ncbi:MAG: MBL fold metallo-hydrolase [Solirubrobacterales bacterium]|nr:MBL fold metallo-hydrolase [Solirubrobacterales bacterium]